MFVAIILAWHFARKFLVTGIIDGGEVYDVFISYSYSDREWVKKKLVEPLSELKKQDGSKINIFFDEQAVGIREFFEMKYMHAIVNSKLFIPVMSREYYKENHKKNAMDLAIKRHLEKLINICILTFDDVYIPDKFKHYKY